MQPWFPPHLAKRQRQSLPCTLGSDVSQLQVLLHPPHLLHSLNKLAIVCQHMLRQSLAYHLCLAQWEVSEAWAMRRGKRGCNQFKKCTSGCKAST